MNGDFEAIRPYRDEEVHAVLRALVRQPECLSALFSFFLPRTLRPLAAPLRLLLLPALRLFLSRQAARVHDVYALQARLQPYVRALLQKTSARWSVSGLAQLEKRAYLFISNHRDITIDPVLLTYALWMGGHKTTRIGFGDNLVHERTGYITDLMRLNKGFVIRRSFADRRAAVQHRRLLSAYIRHSITEEGESVWIAQRNGRAKDGNDRTHPGLLRMLALSGEGDFSAAIRSLCIVPVSISYEYDPCDGAKAKELYLAERHGAYDKAEHEDMQSIAAGVTGWKGRVHVAFGRVLERDFSEPDAVVAELDRQIIGNYVLFPSNYFACHALDGAWPSGTYGAGKQVFRPGELRREREFFRRRIAAMAAEHRQYALRMYANALWNQQRLTPESPAGFGADAARPASAPPSAAVAEDRLGAVRQ